jgi:hypothetical protein
MRDLELKGTERFVTTLQFVEYANNHIDQYQPHSTSTSTQTSDKTNGLSRRHVIYVMDEEDTPTAQQREIDSAHGHILITNIKKNNYGACTQPGIMGRYCMEIVKDPSVVSTAEQPYNSGEIRVRAHYCSCDGPCFGRVNEECAYVAEMGEWKTMRCVKLPPPNPTAEAARIECYHRILSVLPAPFVMPQCIVVGLKGGALAMIDRLPWRLEEPKTYTLDTVKFSFKTHDPVLQIRSLIECTIPDGVAPPIDEGMRHFSIDPKRSNLTPRLVSLGSVVLPFEASVISSKNLFDCVLYSAVTEYQVEVTGVAQTRQLFSFSSDMLNLLSDVESTM